MGAWELLGIAVGDGTGGDVLFDHNFEAGFIYSLEAVGTLADDGAAHDVRVTWEPRFLVGAQAYQVGVASVIVGGNVVSASRDAGLRYLPVSHPYPGDATPVGVTITVEANNAGTFYRVNAWGYYWGLGAILTDTGPLRPN